MHVSINSTKLPGASAEIRYEGLCSGGLGAEPPAAGGTGGLGAEPPALETFAFFFKNNLILVLFW